MVVLGLSFFEEILSWCDRRQGNLEWIGLGMAGQQPLVEWWKDVAFGCLGSYSRVALCLVVLVSFNPGHIMAEASWLLFPQPADVGKKNVLSVMRVLSFWRVAQKKSVKLPSDAAVINACVDLGIWMGSIR